MNTKQAQLGMNPSTAQGRLLKNLLFDFAIKAGHKCYRCGGELTRETFSIEHIIPWLNSDDPVELFFSIDNIAYSHLLCNIKDARKSKRTYPKKHNLATYRNYGCRCGVCRAAKAMETAKRK
tara:strand:- start:3040 stop:3405 length:366 start_codon:yes stop_codon:yes gene_type:complete